MEKFEKTMGTAFEYAVLFMAILTTAAIYFNRWQLLMAAGAWVTYATLRHENKKSKTSRK